MTYFLMFIAAASNGKFTDFNYRLPVVGFNVVITRACDHYRESISRRINATCLKVYEVEAFVIIRF